MRKENLIIKVEYNVECCQLGELSKAWLDVLFTSGERCNTIVLVYRGVILHTLISYEDYVWIDANDCLEWFLKCSNNNKVWNDLSSDDIEKLLKENLIAPRYLLIDFLENSKALLWKCTNVGFWTESFCEVRSLLGEKGVQVYTINYPSINQVVSDKRHDDVYTPMMFDIVPYIRKNLIRTERLPVDKISDKPQEFIDGKFLNQPYRKFGKKERKTIYLYGTCLINTTLNAQGEDLATVFYEMVKEEYNVVAISDVGYEVAFSKRILEYDIKRHDIVLLFFFNLVDADIDLTSLYNTYSGDKWLYQDHPIHATVTGNRLVAELLYEKVIIPNMIEPSVKKGKDIIYFGEPQFTYEREMEIRNYCKKVKKCNIPECSSVGAIVMNCNPFTFGHEYLIKYASSKVDYLYVFCVEEDLSVFPFWDRFFMIRDAIKNIENVILVPSGRFIISKDTFEGYFLKEHLLEEVNAADDIYCFARYIAKDLNITKRFVGEEPFDWVTAGYNRQMKEILPRYGVEVIEIPRKETEGNITISASTVRKLLLEGEWENLKNFVPDTTLDYLKKNVEFIVGRIKKQTNCSVGKVSNYMDEMKRKMLDFINENANVVIYGMGHNADTILQSISEERKKSLVYCDKRAEKEILYLNEKRIISPKELLSSYEKYHIFVTSTKYSREIYREFDAMGIDMNKCYFNHVCE